MNTTREKKIDIDVTVKEKITNLILVRSCSNKNDTEVEVSHIRIDELKTMLRRYSPKTIHRGSLGLF